MCSLIALMHYHYNTTPLFNLYRSASVSAAVAVLSLAQITHAFHTVLYNIYHKAGKSGLYENNA